VLEKPCPDGRKVTIIAARGRQGGLSLAVVSPTPITDEERKGVHRSLMQTLKEELG
jgi:hypothetical protein